jgi:4-hydroxy-3-methylbut-2-enyl diphosphate reductase
MADDPLYFQKGFGLKQQVQAPLERDYTSPVVDLLKAGNFVLTLGDLTLKLAREFGFCYGVDRTVQYAYETLMRFPERRIFITDEIIHNPFVNETLIARGMKFLFGRYACGITLDQLRADDVVILPAFGVTADMLARLRTVNCTLVDTTCGSVLNVWKNVEKYAREGFTAIVHGKYDHEETRATTSQALKYPGGRYLVVRDLAEARLVVDFIINGGDAKAFKERFARACNPGFDPEKDLLHIALANQTTMLMSESLEIEKLLRDAIFKRWGPDEGAKHVRAFDTICSATQDRQDAMKELLNEKLDVVIVIGGYNSSNTGHLAEMSVGKRPTFHIQGAEDMVSLDAIKHRDPHTHKVVESKNWLPAGPLIVGLTAGASTPNSKIGEVVERMLTLRGIPIPAAV